MDEMVKRWPDGDGGTVSLADLGYLCGSSTSPFSSESLLHATPMLLNSPTPPPPPMSLNPRTPCYSIHPRAVNGYVYGQSMTHSNFSPFVKMRQK